MKSAAKSKLPQSNKFDFTGCISTTSIFSSLPALRTRRTLSHRQLNVAESAAIANPRVAVALVSVAEMEGRRQYSVQTSRHRTVPTEKTRCLNPFYLCEPTTRAQGSRNELDSAARKNCENNRA
jgi:hypothetical protein